VLLILEQRRSSLQSLLFPPEHLKPPWRVSNVISLSETALLTMQTVSSTKLFAELNPMISKLLRWLCLRSGSCLKCEELPKTDSCPVPLQATWRRNQETELMGVPVSDVNMQDRMDSDLHLATKSPRKETHPTRKSMINNHRMGTPFR
jgi:hypothetical protein